MYSSITSLPYNYRAGLASLGEFSWDAVFWVFNAVSNFVYPRYSLAIDDLRRKQHELEGEYLANQPIIEKTALSLLEKSKGECISYLAEYSINSGQNTYDTWKKFFEFLNMKYMDGVVKDENGNPIRVGYPDEFKELIAQEDGDNMKMKMIEPEINASFNDHIFNGNSALENREYEKAIEHFSAALKLKPEEKLPAQKIEKIKSVLSSIDEIHNLQFSN